MQTLVPIGTFEDKARKLLGKAGFDDMLEFLARRPKAGRIIQGTGGLRKVRFARPGKGKSGGTRVIYYYTRQQQADSLAADLCESRPGQFDGCAKSATEETRQRHY